MGNSSNVLIGVAEMKIAYPVGAAYVSIGYTKDGVNVEYNADTYDIEVDEKTFPIKRSIVKEGVKVTCNMSESSLYNLDKALAGSVLAGSVITLGGGANKEMSLQVIGKNPAGYARTFLFSLVTAVGSVGLKYTKKGETVVPVTFEVLDGTITMTDSTS